MAAAQSTTESRGYMSIRLTVISQMEQVAKEQNVKLPPLSDALVLLDSGLDSLGFAILVTRLEDKSASIRSPRLMRFIFL